MTTTDLDQLLAPGFAQMLEALSAWLAAAEAHGVDPDALMAARLAGDMHPLATQVRFACFQAVEPAYRLRGLDVPDTVDALRQDGQAVSNAPGSVADAQACIARAQAMIAALPPLAEGGDPDAPLRLALPNGMAFALTARQFVRDWAMPQFYFHLNTAYALIRAQGVPIGKADYVRHMFAYLEAPPAA